MGGVESWSVGPVSLPGGPRPSESIWEHIQLHNVPWRGRGRLRGRKYSSLTPAGQCCALFREALCFWATEGLSKEPLIWTVLVQSISSESPGSHRPQVPALSAPASHPCGLPGQLLAAPAPRDGEGPSLNLDAIRGNQPKTPRQLLPQDYSQSAKDIRVII